MNAFQVEHSSPANGDKKVPQMLLEYSAKENAAMIKQIIPTTISAESTTFPLLTTIALGSITVAIVIEPTGVLHFGQETQVSSNLNPQAAQ